MTRPRLAARILRRVEYIEETFEIELPPVLDRDGALSRAFLAALSAKGIPASRVLGA